MPNPYPCGQNPLTPLIIAAFQAEQCHLNTRIKSMYKSSHYMLPCDIKESFFNSPIVQINNYICVNGLRLSQL